MSEMPFDLDNENCDGFNFFVDKEGNKVVQTFDYSESGQKLKGSDLGDLFEIIIVPQKPLKEAERFRAILISPKVYINRLLDDGFIGIVGKATTQSEKRFIEWENEINAKISLIKDENMSVHFSNAKE
jgi:hypothetical protein